MKNIRQKVFETNSSSTHSISISADSDGMLESLFVDGAGFVILTGGEFGWEWARYNNAEVKANYAAVHAVNHVSTSPQKDMLVKVIKEHTGAKNVIFNFSGADDYSCENWSYIDHESVGVVSEAFKDEETLKNWIFNPKSWLFTGNDNTPAPPNFYDVEEKQYKYELVISGIKETAKFEKSPGKIELQEMIDNLLERSFEEDIYPYRRSIRYDDWPLKLEDGTTRHSFERFDKNEVIVFITNFNYESRRDEIHAEKIHEFKLKEL